MADTVRLEEVSIGDESASGKAEKVKIDGEWKWIPLSVVKEIHRDPRSKDSDVIVIERWFAEKEGLE